MANSASTAPVISPRVHTLSAEVKLILDTPPVWIIRWGNVLLLGVLLTGLLLSGLVSYPSTISGKVVVTGGSAAKVRVVVAAAEAKRIHAGQRVVIDLHAFQSEKFGALTGQVASATPVVRGSGQVVLEVVLDQGYRTTYGLHLPVYKENTGSARITVTDQRLYERVLSF
ncbi:hypothetical protein [Hymenobacter koreensis]|uniref:HlyD family efflux transporter periplasmic adaptor subunit n=1 Tax=Hymenobacter koreensis TaxID=1084523 RepID=A0ABP8J216_9BACT